MCRREVAENRIFVTKTCSEHTRNGSKVQVLFTDQLMGTYSEQLMLCGLPEMRG